MQHLRTTFDIPDRATLERLLHRAQHLKRRRAERRLAPTLSGRVVGMLFEKASTRTRPSLEAGVALLGGATVVLHARDAHALGEEHEPLRDAARVLGSYVDALVARMRSHADLEELARHARVSVVNGQSELDHPCQVVTDLFTVFERKERPFETRWAYVGEARGTANGLVALAALTGIELAMALPEGSALDAQTLARARAAGARVTVGHDPQAAVRDAGVVSTEAWTSLSALEPSARAARVAALTPLQVNDALLSHAADDAVVLHPLPARRGQEITDDALEGMRSVAFQQAGNRLCVQQALLEWLLGVPAEAA
ncbi:MAG: ornithine carbamoyltransferase [Deltaproteobacteria bacterium]|nr:ornithine carbamoyltransferase [Deltaproteobacteria bacterium]